MKMLYQRVGGELCPVFPGAHPAKPGILFCEQPRLREELLNGPGVVSLSKFSEAVRATYKPRIVLDRTNRPLRIAICGNKDAGKDKLAHCIRSMMPRRSVEIASISKHVLLPIMGEVLHGSRDHRLLEQSYECRDVCRQFWYDAGESITQTDPSFLIRYAVREKDDLTGILATLNMIKPDITLVTGIRGEHELDAAMSEGLLDFSVYVSRKGTADATNQIKSSKTDVVFNNSGTVHDMRERVSRLVRSLLTSVG